MTEREVKEVEKIIGHTFHNKGLLQRAFIHKSKGKVNNQRLEFLGDAVLELVVSEQEYFRSEASEGAMTKERIKQVKNNALQKIAKKLSLDEYMQFEGNRENNLGEDAIADLFEAVVASIYLDGGMAKAKEFIERSLPLLEERDEDNVSKLKEFLEGRKLPPPVEIVHREGKDNAPRFFVTLTAEGFSGLGEGKNKKLARQIASKELLDKLKNIEK